MRFTLSTFALVLAACGTRTPDTGAARDSMSAEGLLAHTKRLASDEFEGRGPGTPGEDKTVKYLEDQFRSLGLEPGNPDGTYIQNVPLVGIRSDVTGSIRAGAKTVALNPLKDFVGVSERVEESNTVQDSEIVFVGYGVQAPEYQWDDFKGLDVKGKTLLMLINDPPVPGLFRDKAMTYYGRWTYKYEIAAAKGAAAAIIIHETEAAAYPFEVVIGSWGQENFDLDPQASQPLAMQGWVSLDKAKELLTACGKDFATVKKEAASRGFRPVPLGAKVNLRVKNTIRKVKSRNVLGKVSGSQSKDEYVIYTAHWDHLGRNEKLQGDQIFNGALDNASGTATLLELAKAFAKLDPKPTRSVLFLAVTAEEKGLLGAKYYAENPLYPLTKTLANINFDGINQWGRTKDIVVIGRGNSTLDNVLAEAAKAQDRVLMDDPESEKGYYYRSDHFEFAKQGVPALYTNSGEQYIGKPEGYAKTKRSEYTAKDYHKVTDEVKADWDLSGAVEDLRLFFEVGYRVAQDPKWPEWSAGTEFKAKRDSMLK
ncbi:MAG: M28 family peptidase [Acidobacteria bacterium]|nr:M28 family peptidase [Acidobacteriota bacterium]